MKHSFQILQNKNIRISDKVNCTAAAAVSELQHGASIFGFTLGQFSVSDLIRETLEVIGPADVTISTWAASKAKIDEAFALFESGKIKTCRFLLDPGFKSRQPKFADALVRRFGIQSIRTVANHAKFIVLINDAWNVVIKTSMNLNNNPRLENYEICEGKELAEYIEHFVDYIFENSAADDNFKLAGYGGLDKITSNMRTDADLLAMMDD